MTTTLHVEIKHSNNSADEYSIEELIFFSWDKELRKAVDLPNSLFQAAPELLDALKNLYALVKGECPSLLEDDHHDSMVRNVISKAESAS